MEVFLEDYFDLVDPECVATRHTENKSIEKQMLDMEVNYLGHIFAGNPASFGFVLEGGPPDVEAQLLTIAKEMSTTSLSTVMSRGDYEEAYRLFLHEAVSWQETLEDESLAKVLGLLRKYLLSVEQFVYF